jgi:hypothetical protein
VCDAHQADGLAKNARKGMNDCHCRAETTYKSPIAIAICFKSLLSILEQYKDGLGRI